MATITIDNATLTIERATVRHSMLRKHVIRKLLKVLVPDIPTADDFLIELIFDYARIITQSTCITDVPEWFASHSDNEQVLAQKFNVWCSSDESIYKVLTEAIKAIDEPLIPEHLTPHATPKKKR